MGSLNWKERIEKGWTSFKEFFSVVIGLAIVVSIASWVGGTAIGVVKGLFERNSGKNPMPVASYSPPKPTRPVGFVLLSTTGEGKNRTDWFLRADTVLGPRTKRLFWVTLDTGKIKEKVTQTEMFLSVNCETMEMRTLSSISYKAKNLNAFYSKQYAFDEAEVDYPSPGTGMMASYKEVCKDIYDSKKL